MGFSTALEAILEGLPRRDKFPSALTSFLGLTMTQPGNDSTPTTSFTTPNGEGEDILLSKPANAEQLESEHKQKIREKDLLRGGQTMVEEENATQADV